MPGRRVFINLCLLIFLYGKYPMLSLIMKIIRETICGMLIIYSNTLQGLGASKV